MNLDNEFLTQNLFDIYSKSNSPLGRQVYNAPTEIDGKPIAVQIASAYKSYGKQEVLKNLNLNVPKGTIFGLLGPSGCGKTTILRIIVGNLALDDGTVTVLDREPGTKGSGIPGPLVGYMPQEIALYNEFSVLETLYLFGYLHNMQKTRLILRIEFLLAFLDLKEMRHKAIKLLSGGQKRRVSMMCALLQEPQLLILDEPTVGVDPLLREKIWEHLLQITTSTHTTVIITTHYIEEARKAYRVGLMRNGRLLAEEKPDTLMKYYNEESLENVFLKLCIRDQEYHHEDDVNTVTTNHSNDDRERIDSHNEIVSYQQNTNKNSFQNQNYQAYRDNTRTPTVQLLASPKHKPKSRITRWKHDLEKVARMPKWHNLYGLLYKNTLLLRKDIGVLVFEFFIPILQITLFCTSIGREPYGLHLGVVNNETIYNASTNASLMFVSQINTRTFTLEYMNWSQAYKETKEGKLWAYLDISRNFTTDTFNKITNPTSNDTFPGSNINLYMDATNQQITFIIEARITEAYQNFLALFLKPYSINPSFLQSPIVVKDPIYGSKDPQFIDFMVPGIMLSIIFSLAIGLTALMFVMEKKDGLLERTWVAGVSTVEIMIAHVTVKLLVMIVQIASLIMMSSYAFDVKIRGPFIMSAILLLLQGFSGMSFGLAISALGDNEVQVMQIAMGTVFPSLLLSGIIWPIEGMPRFTRIISNFSPLTHVAEAMRCISSRGWGLLHFEVWFGLITVILWSAFFNVLAAIVFSIRQ